MPQFLSIGIIPAPIPSFVPHGHDTWEIVLYTFGRGVSRIGDQDIPFEPGTIICMPPKILHQEMSEAGYTNMYMHTDEYPWDGRVPVFRDTPERSFYNVSQILHREYVLKQPHWKLVTQDLFDILMLYLNRWQDKEPAHPLVEQLKSTIAANLPNPEFDVGAAIGELPISTDHLRKVFSKATGCTPLDYLTRLRMAEARHLLKLGGFSVKEVAVRVGIADPYYFSRLFRKTIGQSPTECAGSKRKD
jgi:AraC-like DNA-binding protein